MGVEGEGDGPKVGEACEGEEAVSDLASMKEEMRRGRGGA
jgi:hypothetical protein